MSNMGRILPLASFVALFYARLRALERTTATNPGPARFCPAQEMKSCDKRPLRHRRASPYIGCMRRIRESARRSREDKNLASLQVPSPLGEGGG